jgi:signal recognition particle subunit SRP9
MVYIAEFEAFMQEAEELYRSSPLGTRYCIKYRHCDGKLVLKVTDDKRCLQFKTDQQQDLKKLERVTAMFFALFASGELPESGAGEPMNVDTPAAAAAQPQGGQAKGSAKGRKKG